MSKTVDSKTPDSKDAAAVQPKAKTDWQTYVEDFRRAGHATVDWIAEYLSNVADMPVLAQTQPGELLDTLPKSAPEKGAPFDAILRDFDRLVMPAVTQWNHPRFFAYVACTGSTRVILGDRLTAEINTLALHGKLPTSVAEMERGDPLTLLEHI